MHCSTLGSELRLIPAMMVVGTPLDDGEEMVGEVVVCGGVDEGISVTVDVGMTAVLLDNGKVGHSAIRDMHSYVLMVGRAMGITMFFGLTTWEFNIYCCAVSSIISTRYNTSHTTNINHCCTQIWKCEPCTPIHYILPGHIECECS